MGPQMSLALPSLALYILPPPLASTPILLSDYDHTVIESNQFVAVIREHHYIVMLHFPKLCKWIFFLFFFFFEQTEKTFHKFPFYSIYMQRRYL